MRGLECCGNCMHWNRDAYQCQPSFDKDDPEGYPFDSEYREQDDWCSKWKLLTPRIISDSYGKEDVSSHD